MHIQQLVCPCGIQTIYLDLLQILTTTPYEYKLLPDSNIHVHSTEKHKKR